MRLPKGSFRMLHRNWWRWCRKNKIRGNALLVLLALEAGPWGAGQYTGLYYVSPADIASFTGLDDREVSRAFKSLERMDAIIYDRRKQIVFVKGMLARQSPSFSSSENNLLGVVNHVERMPENSQAVQKFIKAQRNIPELYELLEGYLEGETEGYLEQTLDLRPEDLDTRDLKTVIAQKSRDDDALSPNQSSTSKGNGQGQGAGKGEGKGNSIPSAALEIILSAKNKQARPDIEAASKKVLDGELDLEGLKVFLLDTEHLSHFQTGRLCDVLKRTMEATQ